MCDSHQSALREQFSDWKTPLEDFIHIWSGQDLYVHFNIILNECTEKISAKAPEFNKFVERMTKRNELIHTFTYGGSIDHPWIEQDILRIVKIHPGFLKNVFMIKVKNKDYNPDEWNLFGEFLHVLMLKKYE